MFNSIFDILYVCCNDLRHNLNNTFQLVYHVWSFDLLLSFCKKRLFSRAWGVSYNFYTYGLTNSSKCSTVVLSPPQLFFGMSCNAPPKKRLLTSEQHSFHEISQSWLPFHFQERFCTKFTLWNLPNQRMFFIFVSRHRRRYKWTCGFWPLFRNAKKYRRCLNELCL